MERSDSSNSATKTRQSEIRQILAILHKWGIHTIGQLAALDKQQLGARLGPEAIRMWERANGQSSRVIKLIRPPESFEESFEFENEIETAEPLLFILRRFLEQLAIRLSALYLVAKELTLHITFTDKQIYERIFKIPQSTNNVDLLFRMLHTHLENFKSKYPIIAVALNAQPIKPVREQFGLFETTLDRKSTRLNSSHSQISYAVFCLKKKTKNKLCRSVKAKGSVDPDADACRHNAVLTELGQYRKKGAISERSFVWLQLRSCTMRRHD